jgi:hypothetical protein
MIERSRAPGGGEFLQIAGQVLSRATREPAEGRNPLRLLVDDEAGGLARWATAISVHMHPGTTGAPLHQRFAVLRFAYGELARRMREHGDLSSSLFTAHLVDLLTALVTAAPSAETLALLDRRK